MGLFVAPVLVGLYWIFQSRIMAWVSWDVWGRGRVKYAKVAELVDALDLGSSGGTRESSSLSFRTNNVCKNKIGLVILAEAAPTATMRACEVHFELSLRTHHASFC